jgi:predicted nucleic acid-binding protein
MQITLEVPEDIAHGLASKWKDLPRAALESLALEAYRSRALTAAQLRRLLGFETRMQVDAFLMEHEIYDYSAADFEQDRETLRQLRMFVVADTSPINYLVLIRESELLPQLYTRVLIPPAVVQELKHPAAPKSVRAWADDPPGWLEALSSKSSLTLAQLDLEESEAIALAIEMHVELLLIDEEAGRQEAARRGLKVAGTLAVLDEADANGLVDFDEAVARLRQTGFRVSPVVLREINERRWR